MDLDLIVIAAVIALSLNGFFNLAAKKISFWDLLGFAGLAFVLCQFYSVVKLPTFEITASELQNGTAMGLGAFVLTRALIALSDKLNAAKAAKANA
ncbi:MAG TPA: hypothetical protein DCL21_01805 [Alphaproteobacteria bacterium]|nr:hypothetical protein [Alphaproteobacteria bacterium]